jgi:isopenicillin N synthase-like dioxygenase
VVSPPRARERFSVPFFFNPRLDAHIEPLEFPHAHHAPGADDDPSNPLYAEFGRNELKGYLRAHPEVTRKFHPDLATV